MDPYGDWADVTLFYLCREAGRAGRSQDFSEASAEMRSLHPDSPYNSRLQLLAEDGTEPVDPERRAEFEEGLSLFERLNELRKACTTCSDESRLEQLSAFVAKNESKAVEFRAREARAYMLIRVGDYAGARAEFRTILDRMESNYPRSRIVQSARMRLAAMAHSESENSVALAVYQNVIRDSASSKVLQEAHVEYAGIAFEFVQHEVMEGRAATQTQWTEISAVLQHLVEDPEFSGRPLARSLLMQLEVACWRGELSASVIPANRLFEQFDTPEYRQEVATAHFFLGEVYLAHQQTENGLHHLRKAVDLYKGEKEIWPGMDHIPRTHFRIWEATKDVPTLRSESESASRTILEDFPESGYAEVLRIENQRITRGPSDEFP